MAQLFTIGHSNHSIENFIQLLQKYGITALADVRSHPYSRYLSHFNQVELKQALKDVGIGYVFLGRELGARPSDRTCYVDGKAIYEKIAATPLFAEGIQRILKGSQTYTIALMCAEQDPITCHRAILVCQYLRQENLTIDHIWKNGDLENHTALEERLLNAHNFTQTVTPTAVQLSIFENYFVQEKPAIESSREELLQEAYRRQGSLIAYTEKQDSQI